MPNILDLTVIYDSTSTLSGLSPIDLNCGIPEQNKLITGGIYDISQNPPVKVSQFLKSDTVMLTKIEDCNGDYLLVVESFGFIAENVVSLCESCVQQTNLNECCVTTVEVTITGTTQTILASSLGMSSIISVETLDENRKRAILEVYFNSARTEVTLAENPIINGVAIVTGYLT